MHLLCVKTRTHSHSPLCVDVYWNVKVIISDSTKTKQFKDITKAHQNSGKESTSTCYFISGGIFKSYLVVIVQGSQRVK